MSVKKKTFIIVAFAISVVCAGFAQIPEDTKPEIRIEQPEPGFNENAYSWCINETQSSSDAVSTAPPEIRVEVLRQRERHCSQYARTH
jgi:hypothetical protein